VIIQGDQLKARSLCMLMGSLHVSQVVSLKEQWHNVTM